MPQAKEAEKDELEEREEASKEESIDRDQSTGFRGWNFHEVDDEFEFEEEAHEDSPPVKQAREAFCKCSSKCMRKPYCRCKKMAVPCCIACHPSNKKCINK
jgi:hypothetical protein